MKVIDICEISTTETPITVIGNNNLKGLKYKVPSSTENADKEVMDMEVKVIETSLNELILHVGNVDIY